MIMVVIRKPRDLENGDASMAGSKRFGRYKDEKEKSSRKSQIGQDETTRRLMTLFSQCDYDAFKEPTAYEKVWGDERTKEGVFYDLVSQKVSGHDFSADDIERFSIVLEENESEWNFSRKAGIFLSALVNNGREHHYRVQTAHLQQPLSYLGYRNVKHLTIEGFAVLLGDGSQGGEIHLHCDVPAWPEWSFTLFHAYDSKSRIFLNGEQIHPK
jgi:hypothetical protein